MTLIENAHVTIIVPCRNEARHIANCLNSIIGNTFDKNRMQVLVVDGMSEDGTREQVKAFSAKYPFVRILSDTEQTTPSALNLGISNATSEIIVRMDAHARYPENYIEKLLEWMERSGADNVGGVVVTRAGADTLFARAIAMAISHPFGVGNAYFRIGTREPRWVDTVPYGCYRKAVFDRIGVFDEELIRNQDDEFNYRLIQSGGKILLVPAIKIDYFARTALIEVWRMYWQYGVYKPLAIRKLGAVMTVRQVVPAAFVTALALSAVLAPVSALALYALIAITGCYTFANLLASALLARRFGIKLVPACATVFAAIHCAYGAGFLWGIWDIAKKRRRGAVGGADVSLSR